MGAKKAKYKYLLFIDADIILPKHFLNRFLRRINVREQFVGTAIFAVILGSLAVRRSWRG